MKQDEKITLGMLIEIIERLDAQMPTSGAPLIKLIQKASNDLGLGIDFIKEDEQKKLKAFDITGLDINNPAFTPIQLNDIQMVTNALLGYEGPQEPNNMGILVQFGEAQVDIENLKNKAITDRERSKLTTLMDILNVISKPDGTFDRYEIDWSKLAVRKFDGDVTVKNGDITTQKDINGLYGSIRAQGSLGVGSNQNGNSAIQFNWDTNVPYSGQGIFFNNTNKEFQVDVDNQNGNFTLWHSGNFIPSANGVTATRPTSPEIGQMFFDTTIAKPIWAKSATEWVTADGKPA